MYVNCLLAMEKFKLQFNQRGGERRREGEESGEHPVISRLHA